MAHSPLLCILVSRGGINKMSFEELFWYENYVRAHFPYYFQLLFERKV